MSLIRSNPARFFTTSRIPMRSARFPLEIMMRIVEHVTDFRLAIIFHRIFGFPLALCMRNISWPQDRLDMPAALFKPEPGMVAGCGYVSCRLH
jgi:hypothetical protein